MCEKKVLEKHSINLNGEIVEIEKTSKGCIIVKDNLT